MNTILKNRSSIKQSNFNFSISTKK